MASKAFSHVTVTGYVRTMNELRGDGVGVGGEPRAKHRFERGGTKAAGIKVISAKGINEKSPGDLVACGRKTWKADVH